jgi:hypothetical protein
LSHVRFSWERRTADLLGSCEALRSELVDEMV